ncbi:MAG: DUF2769 domain-containing protein [Candidatus Bathyarchaeota archaeon]|nr:MAG: DUF2769 domain-containing protein [Candidatus Bathyarchaeota archaeon]
MAKRTEKDSWLDLSPEEWNALMDRWKERMYRVMRMSAAERRKLMSNPVLAKTICNCTYRPTYENSDETELLFCVLGRSPNIGKERGCVCVLSPVAAFKKLIYFYHCIRGKEDVQKRGSS